MITTDATSSSIDTHYAFHGEKEHREDGRFRYADKDERVKHVSSRNLASSPHDRHSVKTEMAAHAAQNSRVEKPYFHAKLSLDPREKMSEAEWEDVADRYATKMGLEDHQCWQVTHKDKEHEHTHLFFNRVREDGSVWSSWKSHHRSQTAAREIESETGLRHVQGTLGKHRGNRVPSEVGQSSPPERGSSMPQGVRQMETRRGEQSFTGYVKEHRDGIRQILDTSSSKAEANERLRHTYGAEIEQTRKGGGVIQQAQGSENEKAALSTGVGRDYSLTKLDTKFHERRAQQRSQGAARAQEAARAGRQGQGRER